MTIANAAPLEVPIEVAPRRADRRSTFDSGFAWSLLWGLVLAWIVTRHLFAPSSGEFIDNHDSHGYGLRIVEFRESLRQGYLFPQWCPHFRGGLGSPYFAYYQPLFFYVGSLTPAAWPIARKVAMPTYVFAIVGYVGAFLFLRRRFGTPSALLAATLFLTAPYVWSELYLRGDFSEFAAMMLVPCFLHGLLAFLDHPSKTSAWWGTGCGAALVTAHPAVSLVAFGLIAFLIVAWSLLYRDREVLFRGTALCAAAAGLAAFYWFPVFADARLVSVDNAWQGQLFDGYYHYSKHFVPLTWMIGRQVTSTPIPVKLGAIHGLAGFIGLAACAMGWNHWTMAQRRALALGASLLLASLWLITPWSEPAWRLLPLLERIQFPWRLFSLVYFGIAVVAGCGVATMRRTSAQVLVTLVIGLTAGALAWGRPAPKIVEIHEPQSAEEIADEFFAPDIANEWMPRGAKVLKLSVAQRHPLNGPGVTTSDYQFGLAGIRCNVTTPKPAQVVLPHYYFPHGWIATLDSKPVALRPNSAGLMRIDLPTTSSGVLEIRWTTTPSKWIGLAITTATLLAFAGLLAWDRRRRPERWLPPQDTLAADPTVEPATAR